MIPIPATSVSIEPIRYVRKPSGRYPFVLTRNFSVDLGLGLRPERADFYTGTRCLGVLRGDVLTIFAGYASDGASPGFVVPWLGWRIGTPSPASAAPGFFTHDFLYQFADVPGVPWDRDDADDIFYDLLREGNFAAPALYHDVVSLFGGAFRRLSKIDPSLSCTTT